MRFEDLFREKYRVALHAARANDKDGTIAGLGDLCELFAAQYDKKNDDSIVIKAKLRYWQDTFATYAQIIRQYGLQDSRVQKFFGLIVDDSVPSLADILSGKGTVEKPPVTNTVSIGGVNMEGIVSDDEKSGKITAKRIVEETPVEPKNQVCDEDEPIAHNNAEDKSEPIAPIKYDGVEEPVYTPNSLRGFIGQQHIVKVLLKEIAIAKNEGRKHLDNILLFGNPGLGKTTLMKLIAGELGVKFELLDCSQFRNSQQSLKALQNFFMRVARDNEPVVIALDEIHMLNKELQSSLLTLLNDRVYVSPLDVSGKNKRIPIDEFTFIAATTNDNEVLDTIKNRCLRLKFQMVDYTPDELKRIYKNKITAIGLTIDDEAIDICIPRSRGAIRYVNSIVEGLDKALYNDEGMRLSTHIMLETANEYFKEKGIDPMGLEEKDLEILNVIKEEPSGAISADTISARVGLDTKKYISEYERYLIKIGFITLIKGRGRSLTEKAINYLQESQT